jgi:hypothetical protein
VKRPSLCIPSNHCSARCAVCKQPADPCHILTDGPVTRLLCGNCCPEHGAPPLLRSEGGGLNTGSPRTSEIPEPGGYGRSSIGPLGENLNAL